MTFWFWAQLVQMRTLLSILVLLPLNFFTYYSSGIRVSASLEHTCPLLFDSSYSSLLEMVKNGKISCLIFLLLIKNYPSPYIIYIFIFYLSVIIYLSVCLPACLTIYIYIYINIYIYHLSLNLTSYIYWLSTSFTLSKKMFYSMCFLHST